MTRVGTPAIFWMCGKHKTLNRVFLDVWQVKDLESGFSDLWQVKELPRFCRSFITNDIIRDNISQSISEYWNEKVGIGVPQSLLAGSGPGRTGAAPLHGKKDVVWQNIQSVYEMEPQMESDAEKRRRSIRLKYRDYTLPGPYFVTICGHEKRCVFGSIVGARLAPSELGQLVRECWVAIPGHFPQAVLHEFVIMPNHLHGIIAIEYLVGAHCCALPAREPKKAVEAGTLGAIVRSFKAIVARRAHKELGWNGPVWQRNYYERVLRDGQEFSDASRYIVENPMKWEWDRENPQLGKR